MNIHLNLLHVVHDAAIVARAHLPVEAEGHHPLVVPPLGGVQAALVRVPLAGVVPRLEPAEALGVAVQGEPGRPGRGGGGVGPPRPEVRPGLQEDHVHDGQAHGEEHRGKAAGLQTAAAAHPRARARRPDATTRPAFQLPGMGKKVTKKPTFVANFAGQFLVNVRDSNFNMQDN